MTRRTAIADGAALVAFAVVGALLFVLAARAVPYAR